MITAKDLLEAGYKAFKHNEEFCDNVGYQKVVRSLSDPRVKLYFLNAYIWRFPDSHPLQHSEEKLEFESRLYLPEYNILVGSTGFTVKVHCSSKATISGVEDFYARIYRNMECAPDLHNND